jgi:hypothetical protein
MGRQGQETLMRIRTHPRDPRGAAAAGACLTIELVPFAAITEADVRRAGESDRETLRDRAAHAVSPIAVFSSPLM